jgi:hypothetical protein
MCGVHVWLPQVQRWRVLRQQHQGSTVLRVTEDAAGEDRLVQRFVMHSSVSPGRGVDLLARK